MPPPPEAPECVLTRVADARVCQHLHCHWVDTQVQRTVNLAGWSMAHAETHPSATATFDHTCIWALGHLCVWVSAMHKSTAAVPASSDSKSFCAHAVWWGSCHQHFTGLRHVSGESCSPMDGCDFMAWLPTGHAAVQRQHPPSTHTQANP
jgi:hypothetical protein